MWQWLVVTPLVVASTAYAAWAVMPGAARLRLARWLSRQVRPGHPRLGRLAARLERAALPQGSCGSCPASRVAPPHPGEPGRR